MRCEYRTKFVVRWRIPSNWLAHFGPTLQKKKKPRDLIFNPKIPVSNKLREENLAENPFSISLKVTEMSKMFFVAKRKKNVENMENNQCFGMQNRPPLKRIER